MPTTPDFDVREELAAWEERVRILESKAREPLPGKRMFQLSAISYAENMVAHFRGLLNPNPCTDPNANNS